ncbi:MAG TPA: DUF4956 domain-containing protein [Terriglobia bacterium]|nr:DUF4956 domain-containing protein [Terriglobia bacterium]
MPEFMKDFASGTSAVSPLEVLLRLAAGLLGGIIVSWIYRSTRPDFAFAPSFPGTLILLSVLIAMVTQVIGDSVARAFSLVGALSIVRFRTVVRDTQDTAYVIFAVVVGMAVGTNNYIVALIGILIVAAAAFTMLRRGKSSAEPAEVTPEFSLKMIVGLGMDLDTLSSAAGNHIESRRLQSFRTARQGAAYEGQYIVRLRPGSSVADVVRTLNHLDGVQSVEIERHELFEV